MTILAYIAPTAIISSILIKRTQKFKYIVVAGWIVLAAGMGSNVSTIYILKKKSWFMTQTHVTNQVSMHPDSSKAVLYAPRCLASIGAGLLFPTPLFAVQARQRGEGIGIATRVQVFARSLGTAFGVALGGVIFQNQ